MESRERKVKAVSRFQLIFLSATWLAGIYVNGFVPIMPDSNAGTILTTPAVASHVVLASLSAATSVLLVGLLWAGESRRALGLGVAATLSIVIAGDSGLGFVLAGGSDSGQSMIMAAAFATALFLTFLSMLSIEGRDGFGGPQAGRTSLRLCYLALLLLYAVLVTGMYVNLFVSGPVLSLPLPSELPAFISSESSTPFIIHEILGGALLLVLVVLAVALWANGKRGLSGASMVPLLLVAYSAYVGSLNLTSPLSPAPIFVPLASATGLMIAIVVTMLLTVRARAGPSGS